MTQKRGAWQTRPRLHTANRETEEVFEAALANLLDINTVPCDPEVYDRTGRIDRDCLWMVRAGGDYEQPWIRDAVLNTWNGANITEPRIARNTLLAVCERINGRVVIQQDNQDWDRIIWIVGAW